MNNGTVTGFLFFLNMIDLEFILPTLNQMLFILENYNMKIQLFIILLLFSSCILEPVGDNRLKIINRTNYQFSVNYNSDTIPEYPSVNETGLYLRDSVNINDTFNLISYDPKPWSWFFKRSKNKKLNLFIYNLDSLKAYGIDTLIRRKIYRKFEYSEQELTKLNWIVTIEN